MENSLIAYIAVVNILTFYLMRVDKQKAIKNQFRIPERTFFLLSILGGAVGTYIGMKMFRHKTKRASFTIGIPILILLNLGLLIYAIYNL